MHIRFTRNTDSQQKTSIARITKAGVTSSCLCKYGEGAGFPFQIESLEDGVDDTIHTLDVHEADHGPGATAHLHKAPQPGKRSRCRSDCSSKNRCHANFVRPFRSPQKLSFISPRKCWYASVIGV